MSPQQNGAVASDSTYRRTMRNLRLLFAAMALIVIATTLITYFFGNRVIQIRNRGSPAPNRDRAMCAAAFHVD